MNDQETFEKLRDIIIEFFPRGPVRKPMARMGCRNRINVPRSEPGFRGSARTTKEGRRTVPSALGA
jgi:hypothetical protein